MNRSIAFFVLLLLAAPARTGTDAAEHKIPGSMSAAGVSAGVSKRLATSLGRSLPLRYFEVPRSEASKGDGIDPEALKVNGAPVARTGIDAVFPNPTNPAASIRYALAEPAHVRLAVYAVSGELVRSLVNGPQVAGVYGVHWDGKNERGIAVASGLYFARLEAGTQLFTRKLVVAR